jgi:N4-bis(aminopropyl)spermidine synthase
MDLREAFNAVSDVVANRPPPLREFDQIYMKVADMVIQAEYVARAFDDRDAIFIGDGDAIALATLHLQQKKLIDKGPRSITLLDFDERIINASTRFADQSGFAARFRAELYNVIDPLPDFAYQKMSAFYTNPPWGASNGGESVRVFMERGMEAVINGGVGIVVIADDPTVPWTQEVLGATQRCGLDAGFIVAEMMPALHIYHLEDAPDLRSCSMLFRRIGGIPKNHSSKGLSPERFRNFYGKDQPLKFRYVRDLQPLSFPKAPDASYKLEPLN